MMKVQDLRVGNFVWACDDAAEILTINEGFCKVRFFIYMSERSQEATIDIKDIEPIEINEEWLIDFGWRLESESHWKAAYNSSERIDRIYCETLFPMEGDRNIRIDVILSPDAKEIRRIGLSDFNYRGMMGITNTPIDIKHVHSFQNIIYQLVGEELTIKSEVHA